MTTSTKEDLLLESFPLSKVLSDKAKYSTGVMGQYLEGYIKQRCFELGRDATTVYFFYTKLNGTNIEIWGMQRN